MDHRLWPSSTPLRGKIIFRWRKEPEKSRKSEKSRIENLKIRNKEISRRKKIQKLLIFGSDKGHIWTGVHFELAKKRRFRYQVTTENLKNSKNSRWPQIQKLLILGSDKGHIWTGVHFELPNKRRFRYQVTTENLKNSKNSRWPQTQKHQTWAYSKNFQNRLRIWEKRKNGKCRRLNQNERKRIIFFCFYVNHQIPEFFHKNSRNIGIINHY